MNRNNFIIGISVFFMALGAHVVAAETVRITNGEWPPFTSEKLVHQGPLSRIVTAAFALEGITVDYEFFPWKRSYEYARSGKRDASVGWSPSAEHRRDFYMSEPVILVDKALFHLKTTPFDWKTIDDLGRWRIGATAGYSYGGEWDQAVKLGHLKVEEVNVDEQNIRKLVLGRIDVVAMEVDVASYLIETLLTADEAARITRHPQLIMQTPICVAFSRQLERSPGLVATFNRGLQRLKDSGQYDEYLAEARLSNRANVSSGRTFERTADSARSR